MSAKRFFLLLLAAGMALTGCTEDVYVMGETTEKYDYDVRSSQWEQLDDCYRAVLDVPAITRQVVTDGKVQVSRCYVGENNGDDIWTPLPSMRVNVTEGLDGNDFYYTTYTDFEWTTRTVYIYVTTSDLYTGDRPESMSFRVFVTQ